MFKYALVSLLWSSVSFATVDAHDRVYLVVQDIQTAEFFIERAPVIGCYGLAKGPQLAQFTAPYAAPSNIGCGGKSYHDNINYLTCAKVVSSEESGDYLSFKEITLDISKCQAKNDESFLKTLKVAARLNFPQKRGELTLTLIK